ncbi:MAG TPA: autorepressor SdpR family transcription factor [Fimbriimonadaceae bacterium]|jgi:DNA-binding transcriptional ArsR family regulator
MANEKVFKALADPTRRKILRLLSSGELTAGQLTSHFDISAPSMSHHFNILKNADLVFVRREGQQLYYSLNTTVFQDLMTVLLDIFSQPENGEKK